MEIVSALIDFVLHVDVYLTELANTYGLLTYAILFGIVFAETGLVVTPFLPGDSFLFAVGALSAIGAMNIWLGIALLFTAAVLGNIVNYWIGYYFGQKIIETPHFPLMKKEYVTKAQQFYAKYGGKAMIFSRFVPIVRTFAPFIAGVGKMRYSQFMFYNITAGAAWVLLFTLAGYFFGNIPSVKENFTLVVLAIIALSVLPIVIEGIKARKEK